MPPAQLRFKTPIKVNAVQPRTLLRTPTECTELTDQFHELKENGCIIGPDGKLVVAHFGGRISLRKAEVVLDFLLSLARDQAASLPPPGKKRKLTGWGYKTRTLHQTSSVSEKFRSGAGPDFPAQLRELEELLLTEGILAEINKAASSDDYQRKIRFDYYYNVT
ncbi:hypothetical protein PsorP6_004631 [Peronosclerospora sorghi]|uniref:Uncharacterized protein n=1 Tax=Peronosclerospora sorghi TaxID=230839 RepID=A0ACC0VMC8_9STRA|nr:hypothetical protein PsorP6_004631 [Peronosclerospora sorghi]